MAFNDARCPKCGKRISWMGRMIDRPACPNCGHQIDMAELEETEAEMQKFRDKLLKEYDDELEKEQAGSN